MQGSVPVAPCYAWGMLRLVISTIAYFIAAFFLGRWLGGMDIPKGMTRSLVTFIGAAGVAYGVAFVADLVIT